MTDMENYGGVVYLSELKMTLSNLFYPLAGICGKHRAIYF